MGFDKYNEDNQRIYYDRIFAPLFHASTIPPASLPPVFDCPYCNSSFSDKTKLFDHIKERHGAISRLLLLNQQVVQASSYVGGIASLVVVRHDLSEPIFVNGKSVPSDGHESDITELVRDATRTSNRLVVQVGDKTWQITLLSPAAIDLPKLEAVITEWSFKTKDHQAIDKVYEDRFNPFEERCLNGFYNYFIACNAEPSLKKLRYEDALHFLSEFEQFVPAANFILKLISFRFNWIDRLKILCGREDPFVNICEFFVAAKSDKVFSFSGDKEIYIEDALEHSMQIILDFQAEKYDAVDEYLCRFDHEVLQQMKDINERDRIFLLKARRAAMNGKMHEARRYYDEIKTPFFEAERESFIKNFREK